MRASLDYDASSLTAERWSDTKLPLNVADEDIWPGMTHQPQPRAEFIVMTFALVRWELAATVLRFGRISSTSAVLDEPEIHVHEEMLEEVRQRLDDRYLKHCKMDGYNKHPMQWASVMLTRIVSTLIRGLYIFRIDVEQMITRLWLVIYHPLIRKSFESGSNPDLKAKAFKKALEAIRSNRQLESEVEGMNHKWLLKPILHWHAMVIVLCVLCEKPHEFGEAWTIVDESFDAWRGKSWYTRSKLWKPLCKLYERSQRIRFTRRREPVDVASTSPADATSEMPSTGLNGLPSINMADSAFQIPLNFDNTSYGPPGVMQPFNADHGFGMSVDDFVLGRNPIIADEVPWDWSTWDAVCTENI